MRPIDADVLKTIYEDRSNILEKVYGPYSEVGVLAGAIKLLDMQPTIVTEKAAYKHGKSKGIKKGLRLKRPEIIPDRKSGK